MREGSDDLACGAAAAAEDEAQADRAAELGELEGLDVGAVVADEVLDAAEDTEVCGDEADRALAGDAGADQGRSVTQSTGPRNTSVTSTRAPPSMEAPQPCAQADGRCAELRQRRW